MAIKSKARHDLTLREIYKGADPELKKRIKADMNKLISEMPG